jgi:uncharacterized membrane protein YccC
MSSASVSFRITRNTEDLAETIHALSQRLVSLERRLDLLERRQQEPEAEADPRELASLENVERLLRDCRDLLIEEEPQDSGEAVVSEADMPRASAPGEGFASAA